MSLALMDAPAAGSLERVQYLFEDGLSRPVAIALTFTLGDICLAASPQDDQLVALDALPETSALDVGGRPPWDLALGRTCLWSWSLTNHTGHTDGAQLLFSAPPDPDAFVQLMVIASQFDVYMVSDAPLVSR